MVSLLALLGVFATLPPDAGAGEGAPATVITERLGSFEEAMARLNARSTVKQTALERLSLAEAQARLALSSLLPSVRASVTLQQSLVGGNRTTVVEGAGGNVSVGGANAGEPVPTRPLGALRATAVVPLIDVEAYQGWSAAKRRREAAAHAAENEMRLLLQSFARTLVALFAAERVVEIDTQNLREAEERQALSEEAERLGSGRKLDTLRLARDLELARSDALNSSEALRRARETLAVALGTDREVGLLPSFKLNGLAAELRAACPARAPSDRPDLLAAQSRVEAARGDLSSARAGHLPSLSLQSSLTALTVTPGFANISVWNVAAVLDVPIFEGFGVRAREGSSSANLGIAEAALEERRRLVEVEVRQARRGVEVTAALVESARRAEAAATATYELTETSFKEGVGTSFELVDAARERRASQRTRVESELDFVNAQVDLLLAEATCTP